jgi:hypothetical protein
MKQTHFPIVGTMAHHWQAIHPERFQYKFHPLSPGVMIQKLSVGDKYYIETFRIIDDACIASSGIYYLPKSIFGKV